VTSLMCAWQYLAVSVLNQPTEGNLLKLYCSRR
jgi:hypothetical protein